MDNKIKDGNFITIQSFMVNDLELKGNELLIYACIFGFSQDGEQHFTGSLQYLANWINGSKQTVIKCLNSLLDKGFIEKEEKIINNIKFCEYYSKNLTGIQKSLMGGIQKIGHNNIDIDNIEKKYKEKTSSPHVENKEIDIVMSYGFSNEIVEIIQTWLQYKKEKKQTYKPIGLKTLCKQILGNVNANGDQHTIDSINLCMARNYTGIFFNAPKQQYNNKKVNITMDDFNNIKNKEEDIYE